MERQLTFFRRISDLATAADVSGDSAADLERACQRDDGLLFALSSESLSSVLSAECSLLPPDLLRAASVTAAEGRRGKSPYVWLAAAEGKGGNGEGQYQYPHRCSKVMAWCICSSQESGEHSYAHRLV